ncbi:MAG: hypothetical protein QXF14_01310 [Candidatus Woesearchaeota archaeon]
MKNDVIPGSNSRKVAVLVGKKAMKRNVSLVITVVVFLVIIFVLLKTLILPEGILGTKKGESIVYEKPADFVAGIKNERQKEIKLEMIALGFLMKSLPWLFSIIVLGIVLTIVLIIARKRREGEPLEVAGVEEVEPEIQEEQSVVEAQPTGPIELDALLSRTNDTLKRFESEIKRI